MGGASAKALRCVGETAQRPVWAKETEQEGEEGEMPSERIRRPDYVPLSVPALHLTSLFSEMSLSQFPKQTGCSRASVPCLCSDATPD